MTDTVVPKRRGRGRPAGASRLNGEDAAALARMADIVLAEGIQPTTAAHRLGIRKEDAALRRLQRKWKPQEAQLMAEARERRLRAAARSAEPVDWKQLAAMPDRWSGPEWSHIRKAMALPSLNWKPNLPEGFVFPPAIPPGIAEAMRQVRSLSIPPHISAIGEHLERTAAQMREIKRMGDMTAPPWLRTAAELMKKI